MSRRLIAVAVAMLLAALGLVACGGSGSSTSAKQKELHELAESLPEERQVAERSMALVDLSNGEVAAARAALAEGCPDTPPDESMEHLREIQQQTHGSREDLEAELADLC